MYYLKTPDEMQYWHQMRVRNNVVFFLQTQLCTSKGRCDTNLYLMLKLILRQLLMWTATDSHTYHEIMPVNNTCRWWLWIRCGDAGLRV